MENKQEQLMVRPDAKLSVEITGADFGVIMEALGFIRANLSNPLSAKIDAQVAAQTRAAMAPVTPMVLS